MGSEIILDKLKVIKIYNQCKSLRKTSLVFKVSISPILKILKKNNIKLNSSKKYICDENYFRNINTEDKSYFLGFIYADGCVRIRKIFKNKNKANYELRIKIHIKDIEILQKFNIKLKSTYPIHTTVGSHKKRNMVYISIQSKKMVLDLIKHGCVPNKSLILKFPKNIHKKLLRHFIRGYFDGDGTVCAKYKKGNTSCSFVGTKSFLKKMEKIINIYFYNKSRKLGKAGRNFVVYYSGKHIVNKINDYLYKNATIYLQRKKDRFNIIQKRSYDGKKN